MMQIFSKFLFKCSMDGNSCKHSHSLLRNPKKFSDTASPTLLGICIHFSYAQAKQTFKLAASISFPVAAYSRIYSFSDEVHGFFE